MPISSRKFQFVGVLFLLLALALPSIAQNRLVQGKVTDDKGQPVKDAQVSIQALDGSRAPYVCKTDKKGTYTYMGIAAGDYRIVVRAAGFQPNYKFPVRPSIQDPVVTDFQLIPGEDRKLEFELSAQERQKLEEEVKKQEKRKQASTEVQTMFDAGLKLAAEGKHEEAIAEFKKALEKDNEQANIWANMADSYSKMGKDAEAVETFKQAIAIKPNEAALYTNMGVVLSKMGKSVESQEAFKKATELNPTSSAQNFYNIGATLVNSGKTQEATDAFKQAIAADANFSEAYYQLGMCLSGKPETMAEAIKALETYIKIGRKPDQVQVAKDIISALQASMKK
jgi:tetratricopeptide (TPR) repeat protein